MSFCRCCCRLLQCLLVAPALLAVDMSQPPHQSTHLNLLRRFLRDNPEALEALREHAKAAGEEEVTSEEAVAALSAAETADQAAVSARLLRAPTLEDVRDAVSSFDGASAAAAQGTSQSLATAAAWLEQAAVRARELEAGEGESGAAARQLQAWARAAADGARRGQAAVEDGSVLRAAGSAREAADRALDAVQALSGEDAGALARGAALQGRERLQSEWAAHSGTVEEARRTGRSAYAALREAVVTGDAARLRGAAAAAAGAVSSRAQDAAAVASHRAASAMELDLTEDELLRQDEQRKAVSKISEGSGVGAVLQGVAAMAGKAAKKTIRDTAAAAAHEDDIDKKKPKPP